MSAGILNESRQCHYTPLSISQLSTLLRNSDFNARWQYIAEFLEDYRWEPIETRSALVEDEPDSTGDEQWDVFLAALAEHVTAHDGKAAPQWSQQRSLRTFWFPFNTAAARVDAFVHAPVAFRRRGVFIAPQELNVA